jgi:hypothetical protein
LLRSAEAFNRDFSQDERMKKTPIDTTSPEFLARAEQRRRTWTMTVYTDFDQMKADEYRHWQAQPGHMRLAAVSELALEHYAMKGLHVRRLQRTLVRLKQA